MSAPRANWNGFISFGEVSCRVPLYAAASLSERIAFNTLNRKTVNRLKRALVDRETGRPSERDDQVKGYKIESAQYIVLEPQLIKKQTHHRKVKAPASRPARSKVITIMDTLTKSVAAATRTGK